MRTNSSVYRSPNVTVVSHQDSFIYNRTAWSFKNTQDLNLIIAILNELMIPLKHMLWLEILERDWALNEKESCE